MKKRPSLISREIHEFVCKIKKQWGHKHLYNDYQVLVTALEENKSLSKEEVYALDELVKILQDEAKSYSRAYPKWSARCLECASELVFFFLQTIMGQKKELRNRQNC